MRELESEYGDRVYFNVVPAEETAKVPDQIEAFGFTELKHGLVTFSPGGDAVVKLPGHDFGKEEIAAAIEAALAAGL
ncbi:MAG: hypothetical protein AAF682_21100 [Planctomycetota bacterium]